MENYSFWGDFFATYRVLSDWMKALWLLGPLVFLLILIYLMMQHRIALKHAETAIQGDIAYTVYRDDNGNLRLYSHTNTLSQPPAMLLLDVPPDMRSKNDA